MTPLQWLRRLCGLTYRDTIRVGSRRDRRQRRRFNKLVVHGTMVMRADGTFGPWEPTK